ncbi:MAG: ketoacyl-ACP synthase III [Alteraurantiacibacter sp.]
MVKILSAGSYIPEQIITNRDIANCFYTDFDLEEWIVDKTGILERRKSNLKPSDQAVIAAKRAIHNYSGKIDFIIVNTFFGDYTLPQTATIIQQKLGLDDAFAIEINMPCAGPIYSMAMTSMFIKSKKYKAGLLIGVDKMLDLVDPDDYLMNSLFGEGAGALLLIEDSSSGIVDFFLGSSLDEKEDEQYSLRVLGGKAVYPIETYDKNSKNHYLLMEGREVKHFILEKLNESIDWIISKHLNSVHEIDYVITHQANKVVTEKCLVDREIPKDKILTTVEFLGNTGSASIHITISEHFSKFEEKNKNILICGMGGGLTWGAVYYRS